MSMSDNQIGMKDKKGTQIKVGDWVIFKEQKWIIHENSTNMGERIYLLIPFKLKSLPPETLTDEIAKQCEVITPTMQRA